MNIELLWKDFLSKMKERISPLSYDTWFKDTKLYKIDNGTAIIVVPCSLHKKHLEENYLDDIKEIFNSLTYTNLSFQFKLVSEIQGNEKTYTTIHNKMSSSNLNSKYTFYNFIVSNSNRFAFRAARAIAEKPGKAYNPLFLYAKSGLGKTHLLHAIGNYIRQNTNNKVLYVSSKDFADDCCSILKSDNDNSFEATCSFKNFNRKYSDIDVLIIDDIQFLGDYDIKVQEYFFNIFNELLNSDKQIIIASDRNSDNLEMLEDRLIYRFNWGLTANIIPPDFDLKAEIDKVSQQEVIEDISMEASNYIINITDSYVRQLECAIETLKDMKSGNMNEKSEIENKSDNMNKDYKIEEKRNNNVNKNYTTGTLKSSSGTNMHSYVVEYLNEHEFKKKERTLKKYNMLAYKKLMFDIVPALRNGNLQGKLVSKEINTGILKYQYKLPTDKTFAELHGDIVLHYTVYQNQKKIMLDTITPEDILSEDSKKEISTYKGVMLSDNKARRDMFKINLLNSMNKD